MTSPQEDDRRRARALQTVRMPHGARLPRPLEQELVGRVYTSLEGAETAGVARGVGVAWELVRALPETATRDDAVAALFQELGRRAPGQWKMRPPQAQRGSAREEQP